MIIGMTYDLKSDWALSPDDPHDANAEFDKPRTVERIIEALEKGGHTVKKIGNVRNLLTQMDHLDVDIVFNICEGKQGRNRESQVPLLLEMRGIPFIGADALSLGMTLDKVIAKKMFISEGIPTPRFFVARDHDDLKALNDIGFPLIVKTRHEGSSKGISSNSRVTDYESLKRQVHLIHTRYRQSALVEEFIRGTEYTVPVLGNDEPQAMPVVQVSIGGNTELGDDFYTYERVSAGGVRYVCPAKISPELTKKMQELAVRAYQCVECRDVGRVDFRVDEKGNPYVLEINPLPTLDPDESFNIFPKVIGSNYDEILNKIVNFALERYGLIDKKYMEQSTAELPR
ncbi:MAG: hypothetical protein A2Z81_02745 [Omnitrophica WOR_2 bacterium GWA2_45_18]|nr:MAG: hypothetical protein A2Z81_02745 [Omnitrophica WOR_2 bacterium GWA2_45_18]